MSDKCNCYRFSPRDSLSGAVAQIADYLSKHPGWNETELRAFVDGLISSAGVETFNGRSGNVTLNKDDVNNLLIANCYFAEADETIENIDVLALYKLGIRIVFTQYSSEVDGYTLAYGIEYYPATDTAKAYLFSSGSGGGTGAIVSVNGKTGVVVLKAGDILMNNGDSVEYAVSNVKAIANAAYSPDNQPPYPVNSVNSKTGSVMLKVVDVSNGDSVDDNAYIFIDETENYPDIIAPDSNKLGGQISSYYATAESVNSLKGDIDNWFFTENGVNIFDPDSIEENIMIAISSNEPHKNFGYSTGKKDYFVTDFIPVQNGDTIRLSNVCVNIGFFADRDGTTAQDENGFYGLVNINEWTATNDIRFIRLTFYEIKKSVQSMMITKNAVIPFEYKKYFSNEDRLSYDLMEGYARKRIDIYASDSEETIIQKMIEAFKFQNCDVCFERAHYGFGPELVQMTTKYDMYMNEIPIGNGCRYYFNGATLEAEINEEDTEFYCNLLGCQRAPSSFELYDGILIATDTRYVVHDESSSMSGSFRHVYRNMRMEYKTNRRTDVLRKCIGGGTGVSGVIDIEGCTFITDGTTPCVSYHGNEVAGAPESEFNVNIRNSYLSNHFGAGKLADNQKGILFYSHNSSVSEPTVLSDTWKVVKFGNEIRG